MSKKSDENYRGDPIGVRFRHDERALLDNVARLRRQSLSDFVRVSAIRAAEDASNARSVLVSREFVGILTRDWSEPVRVKIIGHELHLIFSTEANPL